MSIKNKNEKLERVLLEKESSLLEVQNQNARLSSELKAALYGKGLGDTKIKALEQYCSSLQAKYEKVLQADQEKSLALNELVQQDLPSRLIDYKK